MPRFALAYPYFIIMLCLVVAVVGVTTTLRMPVDLFPQVKIPVVVVATFYAGMPPQQIEDRIVVPARIAKLERIAVRLRQHRQEGRNVGGPFLEGRERIFQIDSSGENRHRSPAGEEALERKRGSPARARHRPFHESFKGRQTKECG